MNHTEEFKYYLNKFPPADYPELWDAVEAILKGGNSEDEQGNS